MANWELLRQKKERKFQKLTPSTSSGLLHQNLGLILLYNTN